MNILKMRKHLYILRHKKLYKIGISNCTRRRHKEISRSLRSTSVKLLFSFAFWNAERFERFLHSYFQKYRVRHRGSGKTEYFKIGLIRAMLLVCLFRIAAFVQIALSFFAIALMCIGLSYIIEKLI